MFIDEATEKVIALFEANLPPGDFRMHGVNFNQHKHVRIVWGYFARGWSLGTVIDRMRANLKAYNDVHAPGRYSDTKTIFFVLLVSSLIDKLDPNHTWDEFENAFLETHLRTDAWKAYYHPDDWNLSPNGFRLPTPRNHWPFSKED